MKDGTIKIGDKNYPYAFNMKARRAFMEHFGLVSFQAYADKISTLEGMEKEMTLEHCDIISYLLITAIESALKDDCGLDPDEIWDHFERNAGALQAFIDDFSKAQEQPEESKKTNSRSSGGKSKRGKEV